MEQTEIAKPFEPNPKRPIWQKIIIGLVVLLVIFGLLTLFRPKLERFKGQVTGQPTLTYDDQGQEQFIQADFVDLDKIFYISKFRSGSGHDFSSGDEKCRSMKHYFNVQDSTEKFEAWEQNNGRPPAPSSDKAIDVFSPVDGRITAVESDQTDIGQQIHIQPQNAKNYTIRLFHIYLLAEFKNGSRVIAGQKIGEIGLYQNTDIAIQKGGFRREFISYFDVMPDSVFAKYQDRAIKARTDLIITKETRDANPLQCTGEQFSQNHDDGTEFSDHFVPLSGYLAPSR